MKKTSIKGRNLEHLKKLIEPKSTSLDPRPVWNPDPRTMLEQPKEKRFKLFNIYRTEDVLGQYDDYDFFPDDND